MESEIFNLLIGQCSNQEEYEALVQKNQFLYQGWNDFIMPKIQEKGLKYSRIAAGCGVTRPSAKSFTTSIPARRSNVIMLAMMLGMTVEQTDEMLMRWAKFQRLYPKHPEDAIWIYLLRRGGSMEPRKVFDDYYAYFIKAREKYIEEQRSDAALDTFLAGKEIPVTDKNVSMDPETDLEFQKMIDRLLPSFMRGYEKLMNRIDELMSTWDEVDFRVRKRKASEVFRGNESFLRKYRKVINDLRKNHELPSRMFLIALGIHLGQDSDSLNNLLEMAGMGPLCPKDRLEGSIAFYLEELYCEMPMTFNPDALQIDPTHYELRDSWEMGQADPLFAAPNESLADYIKRRLMETNIFEKDENKSIQEMLQML